MHRDPARREIAGRRLGWRPPKPPPSAPERLGGLAQRRFARDADIVQQVAVVALGDRQERLPLPAPCAPQPQPRPQLLYRAGTSPPPGWARFNVGRGGPILDQRFRHVLLPTLRPSGTGAAGSLSITPGKAWQQTMLSLA